MVLTEAFAAGTPVVASDIAGYRDVVTDGDDGLLVPRGDATRAGRDAARPRAGPARASQRAGRRRAASAPSATRGRASPSRSSRPTRTRARCRSPRARRRAPRCASARCPPTAAAHARAAAAVAGAAPSRRARAARADRPPRGARRRRARRRRLGSLARGPAHRLHADRRTRWCAPARPGCCVALALMCASMLLRAVSWHAILQRGAAATRGRGCVDAVQGTTIGVLMSATLPARLGEPSRALVVARRLGRPRERLPVVLGTLVSQTLINVLALVILGAVMFTTIGLFAGRQQALLWYALAPFGVLVRRARGAGAAALRAAVALARVQRWVAQARARAGPRAHGPGRLPPPAARAPRRSRCSSAPGRCSGSPATCCSSRSGSTAPADLGAAAAVLFAVNVTAVLPVTPSNLGVFQAACMAVLTGAYGVDAGAGARLRDHPAGGRDRHRRRHGRPRAAQGGPVLARGAPARAAHRAGLAAGRRSAAASPRSPRRASRCPPCARRSAARRRPRGGGGWTSLASSRASEA